MNRKHVRSSSFSLIELLVVVGIMGGLLAIAIPNFAALMGGNRLNEGVADVHGALSRARNSAISKRKTVKFEIITEGTKNYFILSYLNKTDGEYYGLDTEQIISSADSKAKARKELPAQITMTGIGSGTGISVEFKPSGKTDGGIDTITLTDGSEDGEGATRDIKINEFTGKLTIEDPT